MIALAPVAVLFGCLAVTLLVWDVVRQNADKELQSEFDAEVKEIHSRIDERLSDYSDILRGAGGLFAGSESVSRQEFRRYVDGLRLERTYPGIQGVGFAQLIPASEKQRVTAQIRREGFPEFSIRPEGARDPYTAIIYLEPFDWRNQRAFGYDMLSEPVRRTAMERARDEDGPAISSKVVLVQEIEREVQSGFLMYLPVYRNDRPHATIDERRRNLMGWVYEPFRMNDLMTKGVLGRYLDTVRGQVDIEVYDGDSEAPPALMYDSSAGLGLPAMQERDAQFSSSRVTRHFGQDWTIVVRSLPLFEATRKTGQARTVLVGGVVISLLLAWVVWLLSTTNVRAFRLAEKMSAKLDDALTQTIGAMSTVVEMRDPYTAGHQRRAAELARSIGVEMRLSDAQVLVLYRAALVYEVGKIRVPAEVLSKPGQLDEVEYGLVQTHCQAGFDILRNIDFPWPIAQIVLQHHERLDGSGYPQGLKGNDILLEARIIAVADVVEAMCSHRPYRPALGVDAALGEINAQKGMHYDPAVVDACIRLFRERGFTFPD